MRPGRKVDYRKEDRREMWDVGRGSRDESDGLLTFNVDEEGAVGERVFDNFHIVKLIGYVDEVPSFTHQ